MKKCINCSTEIKSRTFLNGKNRNTHFRKNCFTCVPIDIKSQRRTKTCLICNKAFSAISEINGVKKRLKNRNFCLECVPFGKRINQKLPNKCLHCNDPCKKTNIYCSIKCQIRKKRSESVFGINPSSISCKSYLLDHNGRQCQICGISEWMKQEVPLVLDHIDGNSENNKLDNLRLVCGNCDMQLPTYKGKNKGKGRAYRRKRYASGLSY